MLLPICNYCSITKLVDAENKPSAFYDSTIPVDDQDIPWSMAQLVFMYDAANLAEPPAYMIEILEFSRNNPGRFTYPASPVFYGTTFLKQLLIKSVADSSVFAKPVEDVDFDKVTAPPWQYQDKLYPLMWRKGRAFASNGSELMTLLDAGEVNIGFTFNPDEASRVTENGELSETVRTYIHENGTTGNSHLLLSPLIYQLKRLLLFL